MYVQRRAQTWQPRQLRNHRSTKCSPVIGRATQTPVHTGPKCFPVARAAQVLTLRAGALERQSRSSRRTAYILQRQSSVFRTALQWFRQSSAVLSRSTLFHELRWIVIGLLTAEAL